MDWTVGGESLVHVFANGRTMVKQDDGKWYWIEADTLVLCDPQPKKLPLMPINATK